MSERPAISVQHTLLPGVLATGGDHPFPGRVIVLNGASSSGKSTIARELLKTAEGAWYRMAVDDFHAMRSRKDWDEKAFAPVFQHTVLGFHRAVAGMARGGNDVVVDHVLGETWRLHDLVRVLHGLDVTLVGVRCPLEELERREHARGNRQIGRAALQAPLVHAHDAYDVEVDTAELTPEACVRRILDYLANPPTGPRAIQRLCHARAARAPGF